MSKMCEDCGGPAHDVGLPKRNGVCRTCGGRIHHYPPAAVIAGQPVTNTWAHVNPGDWLSHPHPAEPKEDVA